ncbi:mRNA stability protein [Tolypocladium ophioglossoides CBS 100239]|uniref:mRNA stability protein n=1 Tax=Tolypocladium ophioglossoides (strain CBS 100239) TaxID=1163406 RepID=A0A0L0MZH9_TOLOC|nr:mRNA stability protein [Tolypocladium ophioglossoides CBS 100239]
MSSSRNAKPHNEQEKRLLRLYGSLPSRGSLLHHQLEGRKYFDSGDFALSQAHTSSDIGAVTTGCEHPLREQISHPSSAAPSSSNVDNDGNRQMQVEQQSGEVKPGSHLDEEMTPPTPGEPGVAKQEDKVNSGA